MHLLVLGGTVFLGRHVVDAALARGHRVTLFNRGTRPVARAGVDSLIGDRDGGLAALVGRRFDAVVDTSGYVPRLVGASASALADAVDRYVFVSSASVYADVSGRGIDETAPVATLDDPSTEDVAAHYGALKAASERAAFAAMPGRVVAVRAGMIVGPHDPTGRFDWWVRRVAAGGEVLAPGSPSRPTQAIDARDLAAWLVAMAERGAAGVFNATGPSRAATMADLLDACREGSASDASFTWVDAAFLAAHGVAPWTDLPFWTPPAMDGLFALDVAKALDAGLRLRPWAATVADILAMLPAPSSASDAPTKPGLDRDRERAVLAAWHARNAC